MTSYWPALGAYVEHSRERIPDGYDGTEPAGGYVVDQSSSRDGDRVTVVADWRGRVEYRTWPLDQLHGPADGWMLPNKASIRRLATRLQDDTVRNRRSDPMRHLSALTALSAALADTTGRGVTLDDTFRRLSS